MSRTPLHTKPHILIFSFALFSQRRGKQYNSGYEDVALESVRVYKSFADVLADEVRIIIYADCSLSKRGFEQFRQLGCEMVHVEHKNTQRILSATRLLAIDEARQEGSHKTCHVCIADIHDDPNGILEVCKTQGRFISNIKYALWNCNGHRHVDMGMVYVKAHNLPAGTPSLRHIVEESATNTFAYGSDEKVFEDWLRAMKIDPENSYNHLENVCEYGVQEHWESSPRVDQNAQWSRMEKLIQVPDNIVLRVCANPSEPVRRVGSKKCTASEKIRQQLQKTLTNAKRKDKFGQGKQPYKKKDQGTGKGHRACPPSDSPEMDAVPADDNMGGIAGSQASKRTYIQYKKTGKPKKVKDIPNNYVVKCSCITLKNKPCQRQVAKGKSCCWQHKKLKGKEYTAEKHCRKRFYLKAKKGEEEQKDEEKKRCSCITQKHYKCQQKVSQPGASCCKQHKKLKASKVYTSRKQCHKKFYLDAVPCTPLGWPTAPVSYMPLKWNTNPPPSPTL